MAISRIFPKALVLLAGCTLFANVLLSSGCAQVPRYPALVVTEPNFKANGRTGNVSLNLGTIGLSDSELWKELSDLAKNAKHWRVSVDKLSDDSAVDNFDWRPIDKNTQTLEALPLEVLLRATADFCYSDNPDAADARQVARNYVFLLHKYPE